MWKKRLKNQIEIGFATEVENYHLRLYLRCSKNPVEIFKQSNGIIKQELKNTRAMNGGQNGLKLGLGEEERMGRPRATIATFPVRRWVDLNLSNEQKKQNGGNKLGDGSHISRMDMPLTEYKKR